MVNRTSRLPRAFRCLARGGLALCLAAVSTLSTGAQQRQDLSGLWSSEYMPNLARALGGELPFTPHGLERWRNVDASTDPTGLCLPVGPSRAITAPYPVYIVQAGDVVALNFEYQMTYRMIYTDGRAHPEDIRDNPEWMGHSVGRWEGETLVVETIGINDRSWLDTAGHEHSDQLRLVERFRKTGPDTIEWTATYEDPVFFTEPFTITNRFTRMEGRLISYSCNENNRSIDHLVPTFPNR